MVPGEHPQGAFSLKIPIWRKEIYSVFQHKFSSISFFDGSITGTSFIHSPSSLDSLSPQDPKLPKKSYQYIGQKKKLSQESSHGTPPLSDQNPAALNRMSPTLCFLRVWWWGEVGQLSLQKGEAQVCSPPCLQTGAIRNPVPFSPSF